jgi:SNF2 family DNA or RNA helicase
LICILNSTFVTRACWETKSFFKNEFATPIDKFGDKEVSEQLRKMVFPFILRRTKEQVAKDLPDKTETILYCEMDTYQQSIYNAVKEEYKLKILEKIDTDGISKSTFAILEGLNKLRMICDCPSLISDIDKKRFKQESIKLNEVMREIEENISNHKMLIFSQFLGMLDLIKQKLDADKIKYVYLDGSTPAKERGRLVELFQTDTSIQIFLISLKAGGVGLNLTAADYVYVIDPWWNPAVEDQAIDRTHRIGQNKKVFAYKLICKNTIEEKIVQLQERKKSLAKELITEDASFVKKLTRDDVAWLLN